MSDGRYYKYIDPRNTRKIPENWKYAYSLDALRSLCSLRTLILTYPWFKVVFEEKRPTRELNTYSRFLQLFTILLCFPLETNDCSTLRTGLSDNSSRFFKLSKKDQWQAQFLVKVIAWKETSVFISLTYDTPRACVMLCIFKEPQRKAKGECFYSLRMTNKHVRPLF